MGYSFGFNWVGYSMGLGIYIGLYGYSSLLGWATGVRD